MALTTLRQRLASVTQGVRDVFSSEKFEQNRLRESITQELSRWRGKSFGEAAYDLARMTEAVTGYANQEQGVPESMRLKVFCALYALARPELRYDAGGYWNKPGDETEMGPDGRLREKDCGRFYAGTPVVVSSGSHRGNDYSQKTTWQDDSGPYRRALFEMVEQHAPPQTDRKHSMYYQMFDGYGWYTGFLKVAGNPVTSRRLANILATATEAKALAYFTAPAMERDVIEMRTGKRPEHWSRAKQYDKYHKIYVIRNEANGQPMVDDLLVLQASPVDKLIRRGLKAWFEARQVQRAGEEIREKKAVNVR